jgi:hypothetical protein
VGPIRRTFIVMLVFATCVASSNGYQRIRHPLQPPESLRRLADIAENGDVVSARGEIAAFQPAGWEQQQWTSYLRGLVCFADSQFDSGAVLLWQPVNCAENWLQVQKQHPGALIAPDSDSVRVRIAIRCLKMLGWNERRKGYFEIAWEYHSRAYEFAQFGTWDEIHDACVSLDIDCGLMGYTLESERWCREGTEKARWMLATKRRWPNGWPDRALGISFNNLSGNLQKQRRYDESVAAADSALFHWQQYEAVKGTAERRVIWAYFTLGDAHESHARALDRSTPRFAIERDAAIRSYRLGLDLGTAQGAAAAGLKEFTDRLAGLEQLK